MIQRRALLVGGALVLAGCKRLGAQGKGAGGTKQVACPSGEHRITVPASWDKGGLKHEDAEILVGSQLDACFVIVIAEPKEDFADGLEGFADLVARHQAERLRSSTYDEAEPRTIHGMRALVRQLRGVTDGINLVYLNAAIETPKHFVQVITWTAKSRFEKSRPTLESVIDSFELVSGAASTAKK